MHEPAFYAHSLDDRPEVEWQSLRAHLNGVSKLASEFAAAFASEDWGRLAGLWHDLGKYQTEFQRRLHGENVTVEHGGVGAALAKEKGKDAGIPLAFAIAGHHGGMPNLASGEDTGRSPLTERLRQNVPLLQQLAATIPTDLASPAFPALPPYLSLTAKTDLGMKQARRRIEFWTRFLFSALVDADFLDTEAFFDPGRRRLRSGPRCAIAVLRQRLDDCVDRLAATAQSSPGPVNAARTTILTACRNAALQPPGVFTLTAPTGGGKTLAAMSFALRHAERHKLRRVIVVIPYTSIIEQNAEQYRKALCANDVLEHHSNLDPERSEGRYGRELTSRHELAAENWGVPVIVTTTVQFFESLFANTPSRCRKLHSVARSVIILDEVQTLPPQFLLPIVEGLRELAEHYGCTVVLSTATPPALAARDGFAGVGTPHPILADAAALARDLERVEYRWPDLSAPPVEWPDLARAMVAQERVLAIVHKRQDARTLAQAVQELRPNDKTYHLSALMCPAHRSDVLAKVKAALADGDTCRVVATQLVEAGVDVDFPVVYRALAGLDSIVQAAGRCNREGKLPGLGQVFVFRAPTAPPVGTPRKGMEKTEALLRQYGGDLDLTNPAIFETYFRMLYGAETLDARGIQAAREALNFASVARDFRLIEDGFTQTIVVSYGDADERLAKLRREGPNRDTLRALQPYTVSVYPNAFQKLKERGALEAVIEGVFAITVPYRHVYDPLFGLVVGDEMAADPASMVV